MLVVCSAIGCGVGLRLGLLVSGMACVVVDSVPLWCVCLLGGWFWGVLRCACVLAIGY